MIGMVLILLAACNKEEAAGKEEEKDNINESGFPIVKDNIELKFFTGSSNTTNTLDWNDILIWNEYEEMTNVSVDWEVVTPEATEEKRNLAMASGDLPDAFFGARFPAMDVQKYGEQGLLIPLNDLIEEHAPNLNKILEENPEIKKSITFADGNIYSLPYIFDPEFTSLLTGTMPYIRTDWLETLGMESPKTTDEFYEYLKAVKEGDPNGNGKADEIPFGTYAPVELVGYFTGSFGVANRGNPSYVDVDPETEEVRFYPTSDSYKEMLQYLNKLYSEGLIDQNLFSIEWAQFLANAAEDKYGSMMFYAPEVVVGPEIGVHYEGGHALEGPNGDNMFTKVAAPMAAVGAFAITNANENPIATIKWADYLYSEEGAQMYYMGFEGETFEYDEDGKAVYMDHIMNSADGLTMEQEILKHLTWVGVSAPAMLKQEYFNGSESAPQALEAGEKLEPVLVEELWTNLTYTTEESQVLNTVGNDIEKYIEEMRDKFISGEASLDSDWNKYVENIEKIGLDKYMEVKKAAVERFQEN